MKIIFDTNVPWGLRKPLSAHPVTRAKSLGWAELKNGVLLATAEQAGFDLFITCDRNIRYQQNLSLRRIAILELTTVHWPSLKLCFDRITHAVDQLTAGGYRVLECHDLRWPERTTTG